MILASNGLQLQTGKRTTSSKQAICIDLLVPHGEGEAAVLVLHIDKYQMRDRSQILVGIIPAANQKSTAAWKQARNTRLQRQPVARQEAGGQDMPAAPAAMILQHSNDRHEHSFTKGAKHLRQEATRSASDENCRSTMLHCKRLVAKFDKLLI